MNKIVKVEAMDGGWKVEARTPDGMRLVVFDYGPRKRVVRSARWEGDVYKRQRYFTVKFSSTNSFVAQVVALRRGVKSAR